MAVQDHKNSSSAERRSYYRIDDDVFFEYRLIQHRQVDDVIGRARKRSQRPSRLREQIDILSRQSQSQLKSIKKSYPIIARYLATLDQKIDVLTRHVSAQDDANDGRPNCRVNLSAGGLAFYSDRQVEPDSLIAVSLTLFPSHREISTCGPVVYCRYEPETSPDAPYRVAVNFAFMHRVDRESLISHVLGKQMATARAQRAPLPN